MFKLICLVMMGLMFVCFLGFKTVSSEFKISNYKNIKAADIKECYLITNKEGKQSAIKMTELESIIIARLFDTNKYAEIYTDNRFNPRILDPYIKLIMKKGNQLYLYFANSGFVVFDGKKQYYVKQENYPGFFMHCYDAYKSSELKSYDYKYKYVVYKTKDLFYDLNKNNRTFKILRAARPLIFSVPTIIISLYGEEVSIMEYKDDIDMEIESMKVNKDALINSIGTIDWVGKPHFYKKGNIIVSYIGDNDRITNCIEQIIGKQYAGGY